MGMSDLQSVSTLKNVRASYVREGYSQRSAKLMAVRWAKRMLSRREKLAVSPPQPFLKGE